METTAPLALPAAADGGAAGVMCAAIWQMSAVSNLEVHDLKVPLLCEVLRGHRAVAHGRVGL